MNRPLVLACLLALTQALPAVAGTAPADPVPGEVLVMFRADAVAGPGAAAVPAGDAALAAVRDRYGLGVVKALGRRPGPDALRVVKFSSSRPDFDPVAASRALAACPSVRAAAPNDVFHLCVVPNDPMVTLQWQIQDAGDADIDLPEAWDIATGDPGVVIAIIDTGLDWHHPDLQPAVWTNPGEVAGNGLDDDGNGWIDDLHGWDAGNDDADPSPEPYYEQGVEVGYHGTHCAGIAAAATDNGIGVAGAGWGCRLMGLKVNDTAGLITTESIVAAFDYALANGASVVSMSFGGSLAEFSFLQALVDDATAAGVVCVAAAGNNGDATPVYPAALDGVIAVGATDQTNQRASFSSYGAWVDVAAPGQHIWSTIQTNYEWDAVEQLLFSLLYEWNGVDPYMYLDGTSMACPLVAGVCGLIVSVRPDFTPAQVRQRLVDTGDALAFDQPIGVKVNAAAALAGLAVSAAPDVPRTCLIRGVAPNPFNPTGHVAYRLAQGGQVRLAVHDLRGRLVRVLVDAVQPAGDHVAAWDGRDLRGRAAASGVYAVVLEAGSGRASARLTLLK